MNQKDNKITIAIDGHSSTGKSTLAKELANALGCKYIDTGAMYRAVTLYAIQNNLISDSGVNEKALYKRLDAIQLRFTEAGISLNGEVVENSIRTMQVSEKVSLVARIPEVRKKLVEEQQAMGEEGGVVMDGRDIGSVVFPNAELKIFMTASAKVRAQRRFDELKEKGEEVSLEEVLANLQKRDHLDSTRKEAPLIQTDDALVLDNSSLSPKEQLELALSWAKERMP